MRTISIALVASVLCLTGCDSRTLAAVDPAQIIPSDIIITSQNDAREYESLILPNGLRILLVSDPKAEEAAVAMDVHVGSFNDPEGRMGLAHFTEHMLFIGTEKYPTAGDYIDYINGHGGSSNAYTAGEDTMYYFTVNASAFEPALDRFSQFFVAPTFTQEYVERERHAVDAEYQMHLNNDAFRLHAVEMMTANPEHPGHRFHVGNIDTLSDSPDGVHADLLDFYAQHYAANKMTLAIVSPLDLSAMRWLVEEKFSSVPSQAAKKGIEALLYTDAQVGKDLLIQPKNQMQELKMTFPLILERDYQLKPGLVLTEMINSSAPGGLNDTLKKEGWILDMGASAGRLTDVQDAFQIAFSLSDTGIEHIEDITLATFAYFKFLEGNVQQEWIFDEIKAQHRRAFSFQDYVPPGPWSTRLAGSMQIYPTAEIISNQYIHPDAQYDAEKLQDILAALTPDKMRRTIVEPGVITNETEPYFQVPFKISPLSSEQLAAFSEVPYGNYPFALDTPNPYMPTHFQYVSENVMSNTPKRIEMTEGTLYFSENTAYEVPKMSTTLGFWHPDWNATPRQSVMTNLLMMMILDKLDAQMRHIGRAGAEGALNDNLRGLTLYFESYPDHHAQMLDLFLDGLLTQGTDDPKRFHNNKDLLKRSYESYQEAPPYVMARDALQKTLVTPTWLVEELAPELGGIELADIRAHGREVLANSELESFFHGNLTETTARDLMAHVLTVLRPHRGQTTEKGWMPVAQLHAPGTQLQKTINPTLTDEIVLMSFQGQGIDTKEVLYHGLLSRMLSADFYTKLRTEEQLGYIVHLGASTSMGVPYLSLMVQSPHATRDFLLARLDEYLQAPDLVADHLNEEAFELAKVHYLHDLKMPFKTLHHAQSHLWNEIQLGRFNYEIREEFIQSLELLTVQELQAYFAQAIKDPNGAVRISITRNPKKIETSVNKSA